MLSISCKKTGEHATVFTRESLHQGTQGNFSEVSVHQEKPSYGQRILKGLWTNLGMFLGLLKRDQAEPPL